MVDVFDSVNHSHKFPDETLNRDTASNQMWVMTRAVSVSAFTTVPDVNGKY